MFADHRTRPLPPGTKLAAWMVPGLLALTPAYAETLTVTSTQDWGIGCLRECVALAESGDEIVFDPALDGQPIVLTGRHLDIDKNLTITGRGPDKTILDGNAQSSVLFVGAGADSKVANMTVRNGAGDWSSRWWTHVGGGLCVVDGAHLELSNVHLIDNNAEFGGALYVEPGAEVALTDAVIRDNVAYYAGGIWNEGSRLTITRSIVSGNSASLSAGGILNYDHAELTLIDSTVSGNSSWYYGGGIWSMYSAELSLLNTTVSGNSTRWYGGGIHAVEQAPVSLVNVTIADNAAEWGGAGIHAAWGSPVTMKNTIIANPFAGSDCHATYGASFRSLGHNLDTDRSCHLGRPTDLSGVDPVLRPLADRPAVDPETLAPRTARVHLLMPGSPAIDAGTVGGLGFDQRGVPRNLDGNGDGVAAWDIGAVEFAPYKLRVRGPDGQWVVIAPDLF